MLEAREFWDGDVRRTEDEVKKGLLARENSKGILIDAPPVVAVDQRETLPLLGYYVRSAKDDRTLSLKQSSIVVAVNLETNVARVEKLLASDGMPRPGATTPLPAPEWMTHINMFDADLRKAVGLPWGPGRHSVSVLLREFLSNQVEVVLEREPGFEDPAVSEFVEAERRRKPLGPKAVSPPHPDLDAEHPPGRERLPSYQGSEDTPPVPDEPGIVLSGERVQMLAPRCVLRGSFRLPVLPREVVAPGPESGRLPDVGDPAASAVVAITIVATGSETAGPFVFRLQVPCYELFEAAGDDEDARPQVTGQFSVDLFALFPPLPACAQTCYLTAFNGSFVQGPLPMALVSAEMLRQG